MVDSRSLHRRDVNVIDLELFGMVLAFPALGRPKHSQVFQAVDISLESIFH